MDTLKSYSWLLSIIAVALSLITLISRELEKSKTKRLKKQKAILLPLIDLDIKDFYTVDVTKSGNNTSTKYVPHYSNLYQIIQNLNPQAITDEYISDNIKLLQAMDADSLFKPFVYNSSVSVHFSDDLDNLIVIVRKYLAEVL